MSSNSHFLGGDCLFLSFFLEKQKYGEGWQSRIQCRHFSFLSCLCPCSGVSSKTAAVLKEEVPCLCLSCPLCPPQLAPVTRLHPVPLWPPPQTPPPPSGGWKPGSAPEQDGFVPQGSGNRREPVYRKWKLEGKARPRKWERWLLGPITCVGISESQRKEEGELLRGDQIGTPWVLGPSCWADWNTKRGGSQPRFTPARQSTGEAASETDRLSLAK